MELEIDEYIRTPKGVIGKVIHIYHYRTTTHYLIDWNTPRPYCISQIKNIKHSKNIIDLIDVGDYVNGYKILEIRRNIESGLRYLLYDYVPIKYYVERNDKIISIVTKEQFENNIYRVGG